MKDDTRKRLSELILEELSEKIKTDQTLKKKLEPFADLPVEKVADAILKQFEYLLSSELRDLIIHLIEQDIALEESVASLSAVRISELPDVALPEPPAPPPAPPPVEVKETPEVQPAPAPEPEAAPAEEVGASESIMEHFGAKEAFPSEEIDFELSPEDWFYIYGFSYSPESSGKGIPAKKLKFKGIDMTNPIFMLDYGDVRFFMSKLSAEDYSRDKRGRPMLVPQQVQTFKFEHEKILNALRAEDVIVPFPFWSVTQGRENVIKKIEDQYVGLLRTLIDIHDATEWNVEVYALDQHIIEHPSIAEASRPRAPQRESKHQVKKRIDVKTMEKLMIREKTLAQDIHSQLLLHSVKGKIDFIIRLDNAFMDDWKSILSARYSVGKEKRKNFCQTIQNLEKEYEEFHLMVRVTTPNVTPAFSS